MATDYLPTREADLVTFATNFSTKITASPTTYGMVAAQATAFATLKTAFTTSYATANDPGSRTPVAIAAKNTAKEAMINGVGGIRELAAIAQAHPGITPEQLTDLGLTVRDTSPTPVPPPVDAPELDFLPTGTRTIRVRLHNENTLRLRKPAGVKGATVFYHVGASAPITLEDWTFYTNTTKTTVDVNLPAEIAAGTTVWFTAFWRNPKDEAGPATTPVPTVVQYGGLAEAA